MKFNVVIEDNENNIVEKNWVEKIIQKIYEYYQKCFTTLYEEGEECKIIIRLCDKQRGIINFSNYDDKSVCIDVYWKLIENLIEQYEVEEERREKVFCWFFEFYLARELYKYLVIQYEKRGTMDDYQDGIYNGDGEEYRLLDSLGCYFSVCYFGEVNGKAKRDYITYHRTLWELNKTGRTDYALVNGKLIYSYAEGKYSGKIRVGKKFDLYGKMLNEYKEKRYKNGLALIDGLKGPYTSYREISKEDYDKGMIMFVPENLTRRTKSSQEEKISLLEKNALLFLWEKCGIYKNDSSLKRYYIDDGLLCLYMAIHRFLETGSKNDAFDVYCSYSGRFLRGDKMQELINFISSYENNASRLVQSHRDHYSHSAYVFILGLSFFYTSDKLQKQFSEMYNQSFQEWLYSKRENINEKFLRLWGLTALFHDIGYQYEIPFCQITENNHYYADDYKKVLFFHYQNMEEFTNLDIFFNSCEGKSWNRNDLIFNKEGEYSVYKKLLVNNDPDYEPQNIEDVIAYHINRRLQRKYSQEIMEKNIEKNVVNSDKFKNREWNYVDYIAELLKAKSCPKEQKNDKDKSVSAYMDHAYYSAIIVFKQLVNMYGLDEFTNDVESDRYIGSERNGYQNHFKVLNEWMDAITAIVMHNKFFEFNLRDGKSLQIEEHPLAYLLIFCDELQCWDRTSFGKASISQLHAIDCELTYNENSVHAEYIFDENGCENAITFTKDGTIDEVKAGTLQKFFKNKEKRYTTPSHLKSDDYTTWKISSMDFAKGEDCKFVIDIHGIVDVSGGNNLALTVGAKFGEGSKYRNETLSEISMGKLYDLAGKLYESQSDGMEFEYGDVVDKLFYIEFVKGIGEGLQKINCFYSTELKAFERKYTFDSVEKGIMTEVEKEAMDVFCIRHAWSLLDKKTIEEMLNALITIMKEESGIEIYSL